VNVGCRAMSLQVNGDHLPAFGQGGKHGAEHLDGSESSVQEHQRLPCTVNLVVEVDAVDVGVLTGGAGTVVLRLGGLGVRCHGGTCKVGEYERSREHAGAGEDVQHREHAPVSVVPGSLLPTGTVGGEPAEPAFHGGDEPARRNSTVSRK